MSHPRLSFSGGEGSWRIQGELDRYNIAILHDWSRATQSICQLDLAELEIIDAAGIAAAIEVIRFHAQRATVTIAHAPHLLAHTLYRIGLLESDGHIVLVEPRQEEPYG